MDVQRQVAHWMRGAEEDHEVALALLESEKFRHACFLFNLAAEKCLKAVVVQSTGEHPPRTYNLLRLAELGGIELTEEDKRALVGLGPYNIEGRYHEDLVTTVTGEQAQQAMKEADRCLSLCKTHLGTL